MTITTRDGLVAAMAASQIVPFYKNAARTVVAAIPFSVFDLAGNPGAGTLAGSSTAAGVVPDDTVAGFPALNAFGVGNLGYLTMFDFASTVACRIRLFDCLFKAGAYSFNSNVTLSGQPSYSARIPGGNYAGTQIWLETVAQFTGLQSIAIQYTNNAGTPGQTTGTVATGVAPTVGRLFQVPLAAGDSGVQKIEIVHSTVATVGTFNVLVLRPLVTGRVRVINDGQVHGPDLTGMAQMFATSALYMMIEADSTAVGIPECLIDVSNG
jgi:hypothetical protein